MANIYAEVWRPPEGSSAAAIEDLKQIMDWMDPKRTCRYHEKQLALAMAIDALRQKSS